MAIDHRMQQLFCAAYSMHAALLPLKPDSISFSKLLGGRMKTLLVLS